MSPSAATRVEWARRLAHSLVDRWVPPRRRGHARARGGHRSGSSFTALLISRGLVSPEVVVGMLSQLTQLPAVDLDRRPPERRRRSASCRR